MTGHEDLKLSPAVAAGLRHEDGVNAMIIPELYFDGLGGEDEPTGALADAIKRGSGRVMLTDAPREKHWVDTRAADRTTTPAGSRPILALDLDEHAYRIDQGAKAIEDADVFGQAIGRSDAHSLFERQAGES